MICRMVVCIAQEVDEAWAEEDGDEKTGTNLQCSDTSCKKYRYLPFYQEVLDMEGEITCDQLWALTEGGPAVRMSHQDPCDYCNDAGTPIHPNDQEYVTHNTCDIFQ